MKKFLLALVLMVPMVLVGCSSEIEKRADKHMRATIKEAAYYPESVKIGKVEKVWQAKNDSSIIFHFEVEARKKNGTMDKSYCEYIYMMGEEDDREALFDLSKKESVIQQAKDFKREIESDPDTKEVVAELDFYIGNQVLGAVFLSGRRISGK